MGWGWHGWYMGWMWIPWLAIAVLVIWLLVRAAWGGSSVQHRESPEDILKRRYASGEISRQEYERMLNDVRR